MSANVVPESAGSGQDVVERRRVVVARLLELAFDVQARRAGLRPQVEKVGPARDVRFVSLGDRLDSVDLAWRQHQRLGAVVLDALAQVLEFEPIAGHDAELLVVAVHDESTMSSSDRYIGSGINSRLSTMASRPARRWLGVRLSRL
jgi:hypothetical protein